jgi:hypothetical protein
MEQSRRKNGSSIPEHENQSSSRLIFIMQSSVAHIWQNQLHFGHPKAGLRNQSRGESCTILFSAWGSLLGRGEVSLACDGSAIGISAVQSWVRDWFSHSSWETRG